MSDDERVALVGCGQEVHQPHEPPLAEAWIVSRLHATVDHVTAAHMLRFQRNDLAGVRVLLDDFADWFIEGAKSRLYGDDADAARLNQRPPRCTSLSAPSECFIRSCPTSPYVGDVNPPPR